MGVNPPIFTPDHQRALLASCLAFTFALRGYHSVSRRFPTDFGLSEGKCINHIRPQLPAGVQFASPPRSFALLTECLLVSFPAGTKIFQFPACALALAGEEFGNLGFKGCMRLPRAYRSLPRPSSHPEPSHPLSGCNLLTSISLYPENTFVSSHPISALAPFRARRQSQKPCDRPFMCPHHFITDDEHNFQ